MNRAHARRAGRAKTAGAPQANNTRALSCATLRGALRAPTLSETRMPSGSALCNVPARNPPRRARNPSPTKAAARLAWFPLPALLPSPWHAVRVARRGRPGGGDVLRRRIVPPRGPQRLRRDLRRPAAARRVPRRVRRLRAVLPDEQAGAAAESPVMLICPGDGASNLIF